MACPIAVHSPDLRLSYTTRVWLHIKALRSERRFGEEPRVLRSLCDDEATTYPGLADRRCKRWLMGSLGRHRLGRAKHLYQHV
jgi:hypothetical protein